MKQWSPTGATAFWGITMSAGHSADGEAVRYLAEAEAAEYASVKARQMYRNFLAGAAGERTLADLMEPLVEQDYYVLADRAWPGSSTANVDFIVVGPSGVFLIDAKAWRQVSIHNGRVFQGQDDVTERFQNFASLREITETTLADVGIAPGEIRLAAIFMGKGGMQSEGLRGEASGVDLVSEDLAIRYLLDRRTRLRPIQIHAARAALEVLFPPIVARSRPVELRLVEPVIETTYDDALITLEEIEDALLSSIMVKPIEEWKAFLHPDQARLARRSFNGPSRIRGAAGTGKTVVGLHRAAYIARTRPGTVLVTTFVRTLPAVLSSLMQRMAPEVVDRIEFSGIHAFALKLLRERGVGTHLDPARATLAFDHAWQLHGAYGDRPDGLNLIGDGQQTIYPGGYTLSEANISIAGRGVIMTKNYRNTIEIADFALSLVAGDEFVDIEGAPSKADVTSEVVRHGAQPKVTRFTSRAGHDSSLIEHVRSLLLAGVHLGDIGILTPTNFAANDVSKALAAAGLKSIELLAYDGTHPSRRSRWAPSSGAKGLEFKQVLVVRTPPRLLEPASASEDSAETERRELARRELYVGMTRARDGLWVGVA